MKMHCHGMMGGMRHHGMMKFHVMKVFFMMFYLVTVIWLTFRMTAALEIMAMSKVLGHLADRLSDDEKTGLAERIRENLFG